jgi:hypothetical protein
MAKFDLPEISVIPLICGRHRGEWRMRLPQVTEMVAG